MADEKASLAHLSGEAPDVAPRVRRRELQQSLLTPEELANTTNYTTDEGTVDNELLTTERYALASLLIEQMWTRLKSQLPFEGILRTPDADPINPYRAFATSMLAFLEEQKGALWSDITLLVQNPSNILTKNDALIIRYMNATYDQDGYFGFPSMIDLALLLQRVAEVTPAVYQRELGRAPTPSEVVQAVRGKGMTEFFTGLMTNSRELTYPLLSILEGRNTAIPNLQDDESVTYLPNAFTLRQDEQGVYELELKQEVLKAYRSGIQEVIRQWVDEGIKPARVLQCPVLYTPFFNEMHQWMASELERFLIKQAKIETT